MDITTIARARVPGRTEPRETTERHHPPRAMTRGRIASTISKRTCAVLGAYAVFALCILFGRFSSDLVVLFYDWLRSLEEALL